MRSRSRNRMSRSLGLLTAGTLVALMLTADVTSAQEPDKSAVRYNRDSKKTKAKSDLLETKFKAEKEAEDKRRERGVNMMDGQQFAVKRKAVEQEMADKQIEFLKRLIKTTEASDPEYPDYLFRLADHFLEKKAYFDLQAGSLYEKIYDAQDKNNGKLAKQLEEQQKRHNKDARDSSEAAARVYEALVNDAKFATYPRMDEALYYYAFELGELGEEQKMQLAYQRLINDFPNSPYISNAYLAFADYYFGKGDIGSAVRLYERVIEFPDSPVYAYALYKLAWCHLNPIGAMEARFDKSLDYFVKTITATKEGRAGSEANGKQLRRDARRDLVRAYVHASKPSKAWEFFEKVGNGPGNDENDARKMMELLANQYFGDGQYTESTFIYKKLQELFPSDPMTCDWQGKIVINTLATDNKDVQWNETELLAKEWLKFKDGDFKKAVKKQCRDNALATMKQMATVWHDEAEKTKLGHTYELAENAYRVFLTTFQGDEDAYELQYYYSELLWALATQYYASKDKAERAKGLDYFKKAHDEFVNTLELKPDGKYTADAAFAQMLAMKNFLEYDETGGQKKSCKVDSEGVCIYRETKKKKKPKDENSEVDAENEFPMSDYTDQEKQMLGSYDIYVKYVKKKDDPELPKIMYHRAKLMMDHNRFEEAEPLLKEIITKFDDVKEAQIYAAWCTAMLVDLLTIEWLDKKNNPTETIAASENLEEWATKIQTMKVWNHEETAQVREAVPTLLAGIGWKKGMAYRDAGKAYVEGKEGGDAQGFEKCATQFVEVFNKFEDHDKASTLLWNAAECSDAAYQVGQAITLRKALLERYPESEHARDTLKYLAESYQAVAYYDDAATRYEEFAEKYPKDGESPDALQNAYLFRLGLGQETKAKDNLVKYESVYKKKDVEKAAKIFWSEHDLLKSVTAKRAHAEEYLKVYGKKGGLDRAVVAEAVIAQTDWRRSCDEPLLYDSCISVKRKRALSGVEEIEKRKKLEEKAKKKAEEEAKNEKEGDIKKPKFRPPKNCGSATQGIITVHTRGKKRREQAQARFRNILKSIGKGKVSIPADDIKRAEDFKNAWAMSMVYVADEKYEQYLKIEMPEDLDFQVEEYLKDSGIPSWEKKYKEQLAKAEDSKKRVGKFFEDKMKLGKELQDQYAVVKETGSPYWVLAAAARTASVLQNFADQLYRADVPQDFRSEEQVWAYCDALADQADPVQEQAMAAYTYCIERSTEFQFFNEFSRLCEEEMQQRNADKYPATNELFGVSIYTASRIERVGVLEDPLGGRINPVKKKKEGEGDAKEGDAKAEDEKKAEDKAEGDE
jgi:TolA-binding protein